MYAYKDLLIYSSLLLALLLFYLLIIKVIKNSKNSYESKRKLLLRVRGLFIFTLFIGVIVIWSSEIYSLIISITALAAALAIATKEVILCYGGSFYRFFNHPFSVGDRIVVDDLRGDVVEIGLLGTQVLEVGPKDLTHQYTGSLVTIPNSKFLTACVFNETYSADYILHTFNLTVDLGPKWEIDVDNLLKVAKNHCSCYLEKAKQHFDKISKKRQIEGPSIDPRVTVKVISSTQVQLLVRITVPVNLRGKIEQDIVKDYLKMKFNRRNY